MTVKRHDKDAIEAQDDYNDGGDKVHPSTHLFVYYLYLY